MTLNISDFCYLLDGKVRILIERKRIDDLASSIKDKRYAEQKSRLEECSKYRPFYLIEFKAWHGTMPLSTIHQGSHYSRPKTVREMSAKFRAREIDSWTFFVQKKLLTITACNR